MDLSSALKGIGMHENKIQTYLACLQLGTASASEIARKAQIHRTTVYEILENLQNEGLLSAAPKGTHILFTAQKPEQLKTLLREKEKSIDAILPELRSLYSTSSQKPRVRFYEGVAGVRTMFEDTLLSQDKMLRALLSVFDFYEFLGKEWFDEYTRRRIESGRKLRVIRPESKEIKGIFPSRAKEQREVRLAPREMDFGLSQYVYDNKVVLISTAKEGYGMIIESKEFYTIQLQLFETLWSVSRITKSTD